MKHEATKEKKGIIARLFKIDKKGLKYANWKYLMLFSLSILTVLFLLQFLFLNTFYLTMKTREIESIGRLVAKKYEDASFSQIIGEYAQKYNLRIFLFDSNGSGTGVDGFGQSIQQGWLVYYKDMKAFIESGENSTKFIVEEGRNDMSQIVYIQKVQSPLGATNYLYISSPIPPIDSTVSVLRTQFWLVTLILFLLSLVAAQVISKRMSKPIIDLTKSAEKLAEGDFHTNFSLEGFTEIQKLSSTLNYATGELSKLDEYRKEFIANISHDLKTPLTIIKFYGEMIHDVSGENPEKRAAHSEMIIKEADWLANMVSEILELSKLQSNNVEIVKENLNLTDCLKETLMSFHALALKEGYVFETDIEENVCIFGSEQYIKRALYNLISNAVNYTGEDKRIFIRLNKFDKKVCFSVRDTGAGIPDEIKNNIWEIYYKSTETHKRAVVGTGLGLSIVKESLDLHNAKYGVESYPGKGSTFWFEIET